MTGIDSVWQRMKGCASDYAARGVRLTMPEAQRLVRDIIRQVDVRPIPPADAVDMYARELLAMIDQLGTSASR